ncbi:MAG: helix-turn-helix domain-containing protein [Clostridia bacterium]|nr:helix-turn-helix domain-containing protein [Clostridia bacterium]
MAKKGQKFKKYSPEFKLSVILDMRQNHLGYRETVRKYWNTTNESETSNHLRQVIKWERKYLEEGYEGLMKDNRGRPSLTGKKRGRPPKLEKKVEEDLIAENQRLRMEIEYLKKLSALVLAEERENGKKPR